MFLLIARIYQLFCIYLCFNFTALIVFSVISWCSLLLFHFGAPSRAQYWHENVKKKSWIVQRLILGCDQMGTILSPFWIYPRFWNGSHYSSFANFLFKLGRRIPEDMYFHNLGDSNWSFRNEIDLMYKEDLVLDFDETFKMTIEGI